LFYLLTFFQLSFIQIPEEPKKKSGKPLKALQSNAAQGFKVQKFNGGC
jgi:hypothetical protein